MKEDQARVLLNCGYSLHISNYHKRFFGKKVIKWDVPADLRETAKKTNKAYIGLGRWKNTQEYFIVIAIKEDLLFFDIDAMRRLMKNEA